MTEARSFGTPSLNKHHTASSHSDLLSKVWIPHVRLKVEVRQHYFSVRTVAKRSHMLN
jgi:hypothetical protein